MLSTFLEYTFGIKCQTRYDHADCLLPGTISNNVWLIYAYMMFSLCAVCCLKYTQQINLPTRHWKKYFCAINNTYQVLWLEWNSSTNKNIFCKKQECYFTKIVPWFLWFYKGCTTNIRDLWIKFVIFLDTSVMLTQNF